MEERQDTAMLSPRERDTYEFIRRFLGRHGHAPLLTEIAAGLGIRSKGTVHRYVQAIARAGLIELLPGRHRGIRLCPAPSTDATLPLLGRIAAGRPIEAIPDMDRIDLSEFFMGPNRFVLRVQGDSMVEAGILDGDMVIVEQRSHADNGDIIVALIDNEEATLKRLRHNRDGSITLLPANVALAPITYPAGHIRIQGVVVGQLRSYR
ncbi:MAG: transcriptional repressor LexA [Gammaproteobacteria bacterium]